MKMIRFIPLSLRLWHRWLDFGSHNAAARYFTSNSRMFPGSVVGLLLVMVIAFGMPGLVPPLWTAFMLAMVIVVGTTVVSAVRVGFRVSQLVGRSFDGGLLDLLPSGRFTTLDVMATASLRGSGMMLGFMALIHTLAGFVFMANGIEMAYQLRGGLMFLLIPVYHGFMDNPMGHVWLFTALLLAAWDFRQSVVMACLMGLRLGFRNRVGILIALLIPQIVTYPLLFYLVMLADVKNPDRPYGFVMLFTGLGAGFVMICIQEIVIYTLRYGFLSANRE